MVTYRHPELMPTRWEAFLAADLVILQDAEIDRPTEKHIEASITWTDFGGNLTIAGGAHLLRLAPPLESGPRRVDTRPHFMPPAQEKTTFLFSTKVR